MSTTENPTSPPPRGKAPISLIGFLIRFFIGGLVLAFLATFTLESEIWVKWNLLKRPPKNAIAVVSGNQALVFINTEDNQIYSCDPAGNCWIPDVLQSQHDPFFGECNYSQAAFWPITNHPRNIISCIESVILYPDANGHVIAALDRDGNIWQWSTLRSSYNSIFTIIFLAAWGLAGLIIGVQVWRSRIIAKQKNNTPPHNSKPQVVILVLPWLVISISVAIWIAIQLSPKTAANTSNNAVMTNVFQTISPIVSTENANATQQWSIKVTPEPQNPILSFATIHCQAEWTTRGQGAILPCPGKTNDAHSQVYQIDNPTLENIQEMGPALSVHLGPGDHSIQGIYPAVVIRPGDHFRVTLGCRDTIHNCDVIFAISFKSKSASGTLGRWHQVYDGKIESLDLDLTPLAGMGVRFILETTSLNSAEIDQVAFWFNPRIENVSQP